MKNLFVFVLLGMCGYGAAQQMGICQCALFIQESVGLPQIHGPIHMYNETSVVDCNSFNDEIDCKYDCSISYRYTIVEVDWTEEIEEGVSLGQQFCWDTRQELEWDEDDTRCIQPVLVGRYRLEGCPGGPGNEWNDLGLDDSVTDLGQFCCNQMGGYVHGCPVLDEGEPRVQPL